PATPEIYPNSLHDALPILVIIYTYICFAVQFLENAQYQTSDSAKILQKNSDKVKLITICFLLYCSHRINKTYRKNLQSTKT
ncbi:MAG TPA: hypothetical protein DDY16_09325, partial [Tenacibaculum sp.]|nr:hypothetical protein [Tenacibaculum sp.]